MPVPRRLTAAVSHVNYFIFLRAVVYHKCSISNFISLWELSTVDEIDSVGSFDESPDNLSGAAKFIGTRPFPDGFVLIRTNEMEILKGSSIFGSIIVIENVGARREQRLAGLVLDLGYVVV